MTSQLTAVKAEVGDAQARIIKAGGAPDPTEEAIRTA
jgi:hypothetical protein